MKINIPDTIYDLSVSALFKNQFKLISKNQNLKLKVIDVITKLANGKQLENKYKDHKLVNFFGYSDCRECHVAPDCLLVYRKLDDKLVLVLVSVGKHNNVFKNKY